jgi:hypothetical protein
MDPSDAFGPAGAAGAPETGPAAGQTTSRIAVLAGLCACFCPGLGAVLGIALGILGLRQIAASRGLLAGSGMAWVGIVLGVAQGVLALVVYARMQTDLSEAPPVVATFFERVCAGDRQRAAETMAPGLRRAMDDPGQRDFGPQLIDALGTFQGVGAPGPYHFRWLGTGEELTVQYALRFAKGAPATAECSLIRYEGAMRLRSCSVRSPAMRRPIEVAAPADREIGEWGGPKAPKQMKEYRPPR